MNEDGTDYVLWHDIRSVEEAEGAVWLALGALCPWMMRDNLEILEQSMVPAEDAEQRPFVGLHFDRGHALFPDYRETIYLYSALYVPMERCSSAITRVVPLKRLLDGRSFGDGSGIVGKLYQYSKSHGSSWDWSRDSGNRVSCFARLLDALAAQPKLTNFRLTPREQWYAASHAGYEFEDDREEAEFYGSFGLSIDTSEIRIGLRPGDLLVLDNVRAIHGRVGKRESQELVQFLIGRRYAQSATCTFIRDRIVEELSVAGRTRAAQKLDAAEVAKCHALCTRKARATPPRS